MLFSTIKQAKNLACYELGHIAFAILLDLALDNPKSYKLIWESQSNYPEDWQKWGQEMFAFLSDTYYDLATISDGIQTACIPAPFLRPQIAKAFMSLSVGGDRHESKRQFQHQKFLVAEQEIKLLYNKLLEKYPTALNTAQKYLSYDPENLNIDVFAKKAKEVLKEAHLESLERIQRQQAHTCAK